MLLGSYTAFLCFVVFVLQHRSEEMGEPSYELLPSSAEFFPLFWCKLKAARLVMVEHVRQFCRCTGVDYYGVLLVVEAQAA